MSKRIALFGHHQPSEQQYRLAEQIGFVLASAGFDLMNGGHEGVMAASARGARRGGGWVLGVTCRAVRDGRLATVNTHVTHLIDAPDLLTRMEIMMRRASGYVVMDGATGTLAEWAVVWEHMRKKLVTPRPIVCAGTYWKPIADRIISTDPQAADHVHFAETADQVAAIMRERAIDPPPGDRDFLPPATTVVATAQAEEQK